MERQTKERRAGVMDKKTIQEIASILVEKNGLQQRDAERFALAMFSVIREGLEREGQVKVRGLGTFKIIGVEARESVSVMTGERVLIQGHDKITFTPDATMKELVNKPFSQFETVVLNEGVVFDDLKDEPKDETKDEPKETTVKASLTTVPDDNPVEQEVVEEPVPEEPVPEEPVSEEPVSEEPVSEEPVPEEPVVEEPVEPDVNEKIQTAADPVEPQIAEEPLEPEVVEEPVIEAPAEPQLVEEPQQQPQRPQVAKAIAQPDYGDDDAEEEKRNWWPWILLTLLLMAASAAAGYYFGWQQGKSVAIEIGEPVKDTIAIVDSTRIDSMVIDSVAIDSTTVEPTNVEQVKTDSVAKDTPKVVEQSAEDPRLRYGAYRIVGEDYTIKVRPGETLARLAKRTLGPGMECYIEAFNGIKSNAELKEGQVIKVPKLELKKKKR